MNQTVKRIVDILFQDVVENEETNALHEELMNNCQEHYQDLVSRGLSEDEAVGEVVDSLKGMKDVIAQYPKKTAAPAGTAAVEKEEGKAWIFAGMDSLKVETSDQDIFVGPSADGDVHIYCDDPEGLKAETAGTKLIITGMKKTEKAASAFEMKEGEEITFSGLLNMVGKAIRNVTTSFIAGPAIRVEVPDGQMKEIELNSRSGGPLHERGRIAGARDREDRGKHAGEHSERRRGGTRIRAGRGDQQHERRGERGRRV